MTVFVFNEDIVRLAKFHLATVCVLLLTLIESSSAKVKSSVFHSMQLSRNAAYSRSVQALENRLRPFLQQRLTHPRSFTNAQNRFNESDLFLLAKDWNGLSPEFKKLYREATVIPGDDASYVSPSGHFEVYYATKGESRISPVDNYGFGAAGNWRIKNSQPNGVPDYVDEVAWALDSAWSMEINRFQYIQPIPFTDATHASNRFKVVITSLGEGYYGETFPDDQASPRGFSSHMEINNDWSGPDWYGTGYDTIPYNGARVTCAHEFFHAIQYAMAWNLSADATPDSFPLSWIEGSAVMMEGLAFEYVYDYIQYTYDYFNDYTITMLDPSDTNGTVYTNSLITKFLHEFYSPNPDNDFIWRIFFNDYNASIDFYENIRALSLSVGANWVDILNAFHTQSYFTGARAVPGIFIKDAPLLSEWDYAFDAFGANSTITKQVNPYAMQVFALQPGKGQGDTLGLVFQGSHPAGAPSYPIWSASCICERSNGTDTIEHFAFVNGSLASLEIPGWHSMSDALVIVTNGDLASSHSASVSIQTCPVTYAAGSQFTFISATPTDTATVSLKANVALRCSLSVAVVNNDTLLAAAARDKLVSVTGMFTISFPAIWSTGSSIVLTINSHTYIPANPQTLGLYVWSDTAWSKVTDTVFYTNQSLHAITSNVQPGTYAVFYPAASSPEVAVFPNPAHLRRDGSISFRGKSLLELWIYSIDGMLLTHDVKGRNNQPRSVGESADGFDWRLCSNSGTAVSPGIYFARIGYNDPVKGVTKKIAQKVFVVP